MSPCDFFLTVLRRGIPVYGRAGTKPLLSTDGPRKGSRSLSGAELPHFRGLQPLVTTSVAMEPPPLQAPDSPTLAETSPGRLARGQSASSGSGFTSSACTLAWYPRSDRASPTNLGPF